MITLRKKQHFCILAIHEDLLGTWHVSRKSWCISWSGINVKNFEFTNELTAKQKLFDLEMVKRNLGYQYENFN